MRQGRESDRSPVNWRSPVLITAFNRPEQTAQVLERTLEAGVQKIYFAVDGPRPEVHADQEATERVRKLASSARKRAEVVEIFQERNLGCRAGMRFAISTFFRFEPRGIVLEDDCLPHPDFFSFCETMLERFDGNDYVGLITGHNKFGDLLGLTGDYFFSHFGGIWGWASWNSVWSDHLKHPNPVEGATFRQLESALGSRLLAYLRFRELQSFQLASTRGLVDAWDYDFAAFRHLSQLKAVVPSRNLIQNIGRGTEATHTRKAKIWNPPLSKKRPLKTSKALGNPSRPLRIYDFAWMLPSL